MLQDDASAAAGAIRDVEPFAAGGARGLWPVWPDRLSAGFGRRARSALARDTDGDVICDWGGGLIWAALPPKPDAQARWCVSASRPPAAMPR